ncbi:MAG: hypothetical protein DRH50_13625 [Deltaproteobacteria bacterium]|nr:MAG: hypothetical protein DRH50_13625 [Deltaproteobacteria bacterium]
MDSEKDSHQVKQKGHRKKKASAFEPPNLGKATRLPVPDFGKPDRRPVCLEVDFPIAPVNALSNLEGNAGKPIYQMSKWWARRRSSVFRSLLIAAAVEAPDDPTKSAKLVWDYYYSNHQKAGHFKRLRVLDPFMGGGTTLVEGARLGFQMVSVDLNPVAWFVTRNELAASDPQQVRALFEHIEAEVKPLIQPFYTTTCPRGHKGKWFRRVGGQEAGRQESWEEMPEGFDPLDLPPEERKNYRWEGPEVIYTFWAKHGPCQARGCGHRTPIFRSPVIAEKKLTTYYIETTCPSCGHTFNVELGQTRMAPGAERVVLDSEPSFTETTQEFAALLKAYERGNAQEKIERIARLIELVDNEPGLRCPQCGAFAGRGIKAVLERHGRARRASDRKKKDFGIQRRPIQMYLLIHPRWLEGARGLKKDNLSSSPPASCSSELGGYAGAPPDDTVTWFRKRLEEPQPVSWARMRRWVKDEMMHLKELLEHSHGKDLPEADLRVILRGKALEFYSRHYGQVYTGDGQVLSVRDALLGINQLLDDLLQGEDENGKRRPPDLAEPTTRLFLGGCRGVPSQAHQAIHPGVPVALGPARFGVRLRQTSKSVYCHTFG